MDLSPLVAFADKISKETDETPILPPGLSVLRREAPSTIEAYLYEPVICLILQGSKEVSIGDQHVAVHPGDALLVSHDLPVSSWIRTASAQEHYLAVVLSLDLALVRSTHSQMIETPAAESRATSLTAGPADPSWLEPLARYIGMAGDRQDLQILGPATLHEVHYRLLLSPLGGMLRNLLVSDSHASRVAKAIQKARAGFRSSLSVEELARTAGMSVSSFHVHFRSVTGSTPLQYLKDLRLIEARNLLAGSALSVSEAAFSVGYESPTHFSRDYSRKYGCPPSKDAQSPHPMSRGSVPATA